MIKSAKEYEFVSGDLDKIIIDGNVMPLRKGNSKTTGVENSKILRGEDIAFLGEAYCERENLWSARSSGQRYSSTIEFTHKLSKHRLPDYLDALAKRKAFWVDPEMEMPTTKVYEGSEQNLEYFLRSVWPGLNKYCTNSLYDDSRYKKQPGGKSNVLNQECILNCFENLKLMTACSQEQMFPTYNTVWNRRSRVRNGEWNETEFYGGISSYCKELCGAVEGENDTWNTWENTSTQTATGNIATSSRYIYKSDKVSPIILVSCFAEQGYTESGIGYTDYEDNFIMLYRMPDRYSSDGNVSITAQDCESMWNRIYREAVSRGFNESYCNSRGDSNVISRKAQVGINFSYESRALIQLGDHTKWWS